MPAAPQPADADAFAPPTPLLRYAIPAIIVSTLIPLHVWAASEFSWTLLLQAYALAAVSLLYGIAAVVLVLGVLVPPFMLVHWVWEVYHEVQPVGTGE